MTAEERLSQRKRDRRKMWIRANWLLVTLLVVGAIAFGAAMTWNISRADTQMQDPMQWGRK